MSSNRPLDVPAAAPMESAKRLLAQSWPALTVLTPASIGLAPDQSAMGEFLSVVESLRDSGYLTYEALVVHADGPILIDAALTARGRAALAATAHLAN